MLSWFDTSASDAFARELAAMMVADLAGRRLDSLDAKGRKRADRTMEKAERKIQEFRAAHRLNLYKKSRLANAFLWSLKDAGWPEADAKQMVDWLTMRL